MILQIGSWLWVSTSPTLPTRLVELQAMREDLVVIFTIVFSRSLPTSSTSSLTSALYKAVTSVFAAPSPRQQQQQRQLLPQLLKIQPLLPLENAGQMQNGSRQELSVVAPRILMSGPGLLPWCTKTAEAPANIAGPLSSLTHMSSLLRTVSNRSNNRTLE